MSRNKTKTATIALVWLLTVAALFMVCMPVVNSAMLTEQTQVYLSVQPNPVGVGQTVTVSVWIYPIPPTALERYHNIVVTITKPDATTETLGPVTGGPLGNWVWQWVPSVTGTYNFQATHPDEIWYNLNYGGVLYNVTRRGGTGPKVELIVQQQAVEPSPDTPLPTEYWTFPINAENYKWANIAGPWLGYGMGGGMNGSTNYNPYSLGPKTAHVLWKYPIAFGGISGGTSGAQSFASGSMYENKKNPNIVIGGYFYQYYTGDRRLTIPELDCIDLATGELIWRKNISVSFAQVYEFNSANQVGVHAYLWSISGTTWRMFDAYTGYNIMNFTNARGGTRVPDKDGNILQYMLNTAQGWLAMWNFTKACVGTTTSNGVITWQSTEEKAQYGVAGGQWRPRVGALNDWMNGVQWNVTIPKETVTLTSFSRISAPGGKGVCKNAFGNNNEQILWGYDLSNKNPRKLWGPVYLASTNTGCIGVGSDVVMLANPTDMKYYGYDMNTGNLLWKSDPGKYPWGSVTDLGVHVAYDRVYACSYDALHCFDVKTGKELWKFETGNSGVDTPYGTWVVRFNSQLIADGKVYFHTGPWHPNAAYARGERQFCVDAFTGKMIWNLSGCWAHEGGVIANGYLVTWNEHDQNIYTFNKGPSKTTVSAPDTAVTDGTAVLIKGTVTDQSPVSKDTPAISDQWMTPWMEYLHMQRVKPLGATGVPVILQAYRVDDKSMIDIGSTYSDINGHYEYMWTPPKTGTYKILATFPGSDAYWQSSAETALGVVAAPPPAEPVEIPAYPDYTPLFAGLIVAVVIAIVIGLVNLFWKRK